MVRTGNVVASIASSLRSKEKAGQKCVTTVDTGAITKSGLCGLGSASGEGSCSSFAGTGGRLDLRTGPMR